jgi:deoxyribodipyrimidine photo-lyase
LKIHTELLERLDKIDPVKYGKNRNFINGAVTHLSPFISRGFIDTKQVLEHLVKRGYTYRQLERLIQQMAWREYFQRVWQLHGDRINTDLRHDQQATVLHGIPRAISQADTHIGAIDMAIGNLYKTGDMHNHVRMYTAFLACNLSGFHWRDPARWMYYHLLDSDWASNALSWQWVAGTFSNKKYIANQDNINHYTGSDQRGSYLDCSYDELAILPTPVHLLEVTSLDLKTDLPTCSPLQFDRELPVLVYNYYNLSPTWRKDLPANRVLLLEPQIFGQYPISKKCIDFMLDLSKDIAGIQVHVGSFDTLKEAAGSSTIYYREHPLNRHYQGTMDERSWLSSRNVQVQGSFSSFWKKSEREIIKDLFN